MKQVDLWVLRGLSDEILGISVPDDFEASLLQLRKRLLAVGFSLTGNSSDAEDLVQSTYLRALEHRNTFSGGSLMAWAATILRRLHIDSGRSSWHRLRDRDISDDELEALVGVEVDPDRGQELRQVLNILADMGGKCRELLLLYAHGYKTREIAVSLDMPEGTVGRRMMECRQSLHDALTAPAKMNG